MYFIARWSWRRVTSPPRRRRDPAPASRPHNLAARSPTLPQTYDFSLHSTLQLSLNKTNEQHYSFILLGKVLRKRSAKILQTSRGKLQTAQGEIALGRYSLVIAPYPT